MTTVSLTDENRAAIARAVAAAEAQADGEIVPVIARSADGYGDIALAWSAFVAGLALLAISIAPGFYLGLADRVLGAWAHHWTTREIFEFALFVATVKFAGMWLIQLWRPLRLWLTPGVVKARRVRARAALAFALAAKGRTRGATGVVIYLALAERRAEILADDAIATRVEPTVWGDAMHEMLGQIRAGRIGAGMIAGIEQVGAVLAEHFPRTEKPANELPDAVIEL